MMEFEKRFDAIERMLLKHCKKALTLEEVAIYSGLSQSYIYKLTSNNEIPFYKPRAKMVYFDREEIDVWLLQNKVKTNIEIAEEANRHSAGINKSN